MGVSVRVSRDVRVYLPFWLAIPACLLVACGWAVFGLTYGIVWLIGTGARAALSRGRRAAQ